MSFNYRFVGRLSCVAAIVDKEGGVRVIITYPELLHHHIGPGEHCFRVPDLWIQEPVPWGGAMVSIIKAATDYAADQQ